MSWKVIVLATCAAIVRAQTANVIELSRKAPPEIFADTVVKLIERGEVPPAQQRDLLNQAFEAARRAKEPVRLRAMPIAGTNTRAALQDSAGALGLDALSLEARIIRLMAAVDATRARDLFQSIDHPMLDARPCVDPMVADASAYYELAGFLAGGQGPLLMSAVAPANSPGELASFATVLAAAQALSPDDFRLIAGALALKMQTPSRDYRAFAMTADELRAGLERIAARAHELDLPTKDLAEGARKLVVVQMSSTRCNEEFGDARAFVDWFNRKFRADLPAIEREELEPLRALGFFKAPAYFESDEAKHIADDFAALRGASLAKPGTLADFLKEFSAWRPEGGDIDVFHQKMTVLHGLFQLVPPGQDRDALIGRAVQFLKSSGIQREYPAEWLMQVRSFAAAAMIDQTKVLAAFRESGDAGLAVFAALAPGSGAGSQK